MPRFEVGEVVRPAGTDGDVVGVVVARTPNEDGIESADIYEVALGSDSYCQFFACELAGVDETLAVPELCLGDHYPVFVTSGWS